MRSWFTSDMPYLAMVRPLIARRYPALEQLLMAAGLPWPTRPDDGRVAGRDTLPPRTHRAGGAPPQCVLA